MPVAIHNASHQQRITHNPSSHMEHFVKLIDNVSSFGTIHQIQQFIMQLMAELKVNDDLTMLHHMLLTMLTSSKHLLATSQLQRLLHCSQHIASKNSLCPSPPANTKDTFHCAPNKPRSVSLPLPLSLYITPIKPITHLLELPEHILSYCCSYLATKDLLLSADLCCTQLCAIARMPSSFHGKFIFGSAIHSEYHKLATMHMDRTREFDGFKMLHRFHHCKEIHFINIFNYDTIALLKTCTFPKIESIYLYDRFNHLIEYLPSLIPNVSKLFVTTNGGNETLDIIQANTDYYTDQLYMLLNGYLSSIESLALQHNTYYDIPLMLPEKVTTLLLNKIRNLNHLSLKNVYFPPDLNSNEYEYDTVKHLRLMPYNEYCSDHFDPALQSLSLFWNVVGQNGVYDMVKLHNLQRLHLVIKLDNDALDYSALLEFLRHSECLAHVQHFELDIDLNDAAWSSFGELLRITKQMFTSLNHHKQIKINIIDICNATSYSHMFRTILPQIITDMIQNIDAQQRWNIEIDVKHCIPDSDNDYYTQCMKNAVRDIQMNCDSILNHKKKHHTSLKFVVANKVMFHI
eukprot:23307_1